MATPTRDVEEYTPVRGLGSDLEETFYQFDRKKNVNGFEQFSVGICLNNSNFSNFH